MGFLRQTQQSTVYVHLFGGKHLTNMGYLSSNTQPMSQTLAIRAWVQNVH